VFSVAAPRNTKPFSLRPWLLGASPTPGVEICGQCQYSPSKKSVFYVFLLVLAALGIGIYLIVFLGNVPGAAEERLGVLEPLPPDLGEWTEDCDSPEAKRAGAEGLQRQVRTFFDESRGRLLLQARYRRITDGEIVRAEPDRVLKRRRVHPGR
jgi:hypothetical protein